MYRPNAVRSILTTSVNILPYRPPARLIRAKSSIKKKHKHTLFHMLFHDRGRDGLVVSALISGSIFPGLSPGMGHCVVFLESNENHMSVFVLFMRYLLFLCMSVLVRNSFSPINTGNRGLVRASLTLNACKLKTLKRWTSIESDDFPKICYDQSGMAWHCFQSFTFCMLTSIQLFKFLCDILKCPCDIFKNPCDKFSFLYRF